MVTMTAPSTATFEKTALSSVQAVSITQLPEGSLPILAEGQSLNIEALRDSKERYYLWIIWIVDILAILGIGYLAYVDLAIFSIVMTYAIAIMIFQWIAWKFTYWFVHGHGIEVGPNQYPQVFRVIKQASDYLGVPTPQTFILQGAGLFELLVAKYYSRRGLIIITSNMMDEFSKRPTSREFMMFVGRQLGHIRAGHFRFWFFKETLGMLALFFYAAWARRCHFTADRIGLLVAGDIGAAERALYTITVGSGVAPSTNYDEVAEQRTRVFESKWAWIVLGFSTYPYMIDRMVRLQEFARWVSSDSKLRNVGALPIYHYKLRSIPILIIHGHDNLARLELENFLYAKLPQVAPRLMVDETAASLSMPEKFEVVTTDVIGAIALLTPDDLAMAAISNVDASRPRARQNVVLEIGWIWAKLGRKRCLLLVRGDIEIPSDLLGVDIFRFRETPKECSEVVRAFVSDLPSGFE